MNQDDLLQEDSLSRERALAPESFNRLSLLLDAAVDKW